MKTLGKFCCHALMGIGVALLLNSCTFSHPEHVVETAPPPGRQPLPGPTTESRGVWVSDPNKLDWDKATAALQRAGFNTMYVNFASGGAAFYPHSRVLPDVSTASADDWFRGIELAHRRGIRVYAKLISMFMFKSPLEFQHRYIRAGRVMLKPDGHPALQNGDTWLCPSQPVNRTQLEAEVREIITRYPFDGLQFDYIRFFEEPTCYCGNCRRAFETYTGSRARRWPEDVMGGPLTDRFYEWRRAMINDIVRDLTTEARSLRPGIALSAAVFQDLERGRQDRAQDWKLWLDRGWLDYVCTMTYTPDIREFETRVVKQQNWTGDRNKVVVGIGSYKFQQMSGLRSEIDLTRRLGAPGFVLFSWDDAVARNFLPDVNVSAGSSGR